MKRSINTHLAIGLFIIPVFVLSCSSNTETKEQTEQSNSLAGGNLSSKDESSGTTSFEQKEKQERKLIKTGTLSLKSNNLEKSKSHLDQALKSLEGYYDHEQLSRSEDESRYALKIRVPAKNFDRMLAAINNGSDEIVSKNIRTEDVSAEYVDLSTRLKSKRAYLERYQELLAKAKNIDELLQIENEVRLLIEEIESQEGRLNYLDSQVGYSTLDIKLYKTILHPVTSYEPGFGESAVNALSNGWNGIVLFFLAILSIWPLFLFIPVGIFTYRKLTRPKK